MFTRNDLLFTMSDNPRMLPCLDGTMACAEFCFTDELFLRRLQIAAIANLACQP
jgi:hypothetical protein